MYYKGKEESTVSEVMHRPVKKRQQKTTDIWKNFKKEFDPLVSKLSECIPSMKTTPFKTMIADWWLCKNPKFKTFEKGGNWLIDFCSHLSEEDPHSLDWEHLKELTAWHEEKEQEMQGYEQFIEGSLRRA
jgi:hypothetical protein